MSKRVRARVEIVIVFRFVDADAPKNDGGMVPVSADHTPDVIDRNLLPAFIPDVLPARNFFKHQQSDLVAAVEEMARLRIVRGADDVAVEILSKDVGIHSLHAGGHGLTDKWKRLVTIKTAQLYDFAVER